VRISKTLIAAALAIAIVSVPIAALAGGRHHGGHAGRLHHGGGVRHQGPSHHVLRGVNLPGYRFGPYAAHYGFRYPRYGKLYGGYGYFGGSYGGGSYGSITYYAPPMDYTPATVYAPTIVYPSGPSYGYPPASAYTSMGVAPAAPPPARPTVLEYATGRYELRGDGLSTPYTWVWIPNPPPPPDVEPQAAPEPAPPALQYAPPPRASADRAPRKSQLYRWIDAQGVVHLTDNPENVPEDQRTPVRRF
jgi:hypothetical protein